MKTALKVCNQASFATVTTEFGYWNDITWNVAKTSSKTPQMQPFNHNSSSRNSFLDTGTVVDHKRPGKPQVT